MTTNHETQQLSIEVTARWAHWGNEGLPSEFERRLHHHKTFSDQALALLVELGAELELRVDRKGPLVAVTQFVAAATDFTDYLNRMAVVRCLEYLDEPRLKPVSWCAKTPPDANIRSRPLTEIEIGLVRYASLTYAMSAGAVGAFDAGMASCELGSLLPAGVLIDVGGRASHLVGPQSRCAARTMEIPRWAQTTFDALLENAHPTLPILYGGTQVNPVKIQSLILMNVRKALILAGLANDMTVKPLSIRNTAALRAHESGGLEAAAKLLGSQNFDSVAREIGIKEKLAVRKR
jgi:hypothetical protein